MGGLACAQLIIDGNSAQAAVNRFFPSGAIGELPALDLLAAIESSCELTQLANVYLGFDKKEVPDSVIDPIVHFHQHLIAVINTWTAQDVKDAAVELGLLNGHLAAALA